MKHGGKVEHHLSHFRWVAEQVRKAYSKAKRVNGWVPVHDLVSRANVTIGDVLDVARFTLGVVVVYRDGEYYIKIREK